MEEEIAIPQIVGNYIKEKEDINKSVIIGNISPKITLDDLYAIFENFGIILDLKQIKTLTHPILCRYFIILFEEHDSTETCKYIENAELGGLPITVYLVSNVEEMKKVEDIFKKEEGDHSTANVTGVDSKVAMKLRKTVCVRNIGNLNDDKIQQYFQKCGNIRLMEFSTVESTTRQVIIEFETEEAALRALQLDGSSLNERPIRVLLSTKTIKSKKEAKPIITKKETELADDILASLEKKTLMKEEKTNEYVNKESGYERKNERRRSRSHSRRRESDGGYRDGYRDRYKSDRYRSSDRDRYHDRNYEDRRRMRSDRRSDSRERSYSRNY